MKTLRAIAALALLGAIFVFCLKLLGVLNDDQASQTAGTVSGILAALGVGLAGVSIIVAPRGKSQSPTSKGDGPQF